MKIRPPEKPINLTPMIDVVFQIIIFFVFTIDLDKEKISESLRLGDAPNGAPVEEAEPMTVSVQVTDSGYIQMGAAYLTVKQFKGIMANTVKRYGSNVPVVIYGDVRTKHKDIRVVLDACSQVGLWKISFAAVQERV